jgi:hypothetical protein
MPYVVLLQYTLPSYYGDSMETLSTGVHIHQGVVFLSTYLLSHKLINSTITYY